jgi:hypothetical protein
MTHTNKYAYLFSSQKIYLEYDILIVNMVLLALKQS